MNKNRQKAKQKYITDSRDKADISETREISTPPARDIESLIN